MIDCNCMLKIHTIINSCLGYGSFRFYTEALGMTLLRQRDIPEEKYANAFLGFGAEQSHFVVELTYSMLLLLFTL